MILLPSRHLACLPTIPLRLLLLHHRPRIDILPSMTTDKYMIATPYAITPIVGLSGLDSPPDNYAPPAGGFATSLLIDAFMACRRRITTTYIHMLPYAAHGRSHCSRLSAAATDI